MTCNGHNKLNDFNNIAVPRTSSSEDTFEKYTNKQTKSKEKEFIQSNSCCNIYYIDTILKNIHKKWSKID